MRPGVDELARPQAAAADLADHVRPASSPRKASRWSGTVASGIEHGARDVAGGVLVGLAHVDQPGARCQALGELVDVDLGHGHGANATHGEAAGGRAAARSAVVLTLRSGRRSTATRHGGEPSDRPRGAPALPPPRLRSLDRRAPTGATSASAGSSRPSSATTTSTGGAAATASLDDGTTGVDVEQRQVAGGRHDAVVVELPAAR